jgi:hypothetical protein
MNGVWAVISKASLFFVPNMLHGRLCLWIFGHLALGNGKAISGSPVVKPAEGDGRENQAL